MMKLPVLLLTFVMLLAATSTNADVEGDFEYQANEDGTVAVTRHLGSEEEVVIPAALGGKVVTVIEAWAFEYCEDVARVTIPDSVTAIGDSAFAGCPNLTSVYFKGDAPEAEGDPFFGNESATVYYLAEATGWGETFAGRPTALWELPDDESSGGAMSLAGGDRIEIEYDDVLAIPDFAKFRMRNVSQHDGNAGILSIQRLPEQRPGVSLQFAAPAVAFLVVEEKSSLQSGEETWRSRLGFAHLDPLDPGAQARIFRRPTGIDSAPWTELTQLSGTGGLVQWVDPEFSGTDDYSIILERPGGVSRVFQPDVDNFLMIEDPDSPIYGLEMDISAGSLSAESIVVINPGDRSPVSETMVSDFELTILPIGESMQRRSLGSMAGRVQIALKGAAKKAVDFFVQINEEYGPRLSVEIPYMKGDPCYWECSPVRNLPLITGKIGTDYVLFEWDIADTPAREVNKYVFWIGNEFCRGNQQDPKLVSCPDDGLSAFASGERNLLLIHGIRAARDTFLEAGRYGLPEDTSQGLVQWALGPGGYDHVLIYEYPSFHSIDENGDLLWSIIQRNRNLIPSNARFDIIAHSMGGMVARAFLRSGGRQVDHLVTLGTPHQGTTLFSTVVSVIDASPTALREALAVAPTTPIASLVPSVYWQYWMYAYIGASVADEVLSDEWFNELVARFVPGAADFLLGSEFLEEVNDPVLACPLYEIFYISGDVAGHSSGAACFLDQGADCLFTIEETRLPETIPGLTDSAIMVGAGFSHTELPRSLYQRDENGQTIDQLLRTWLGPEPATNPVSIEMVPIPGGTFLMGDEWGDGWADEGPVHSVTLSPFSISKYEVTNEQMREVMQWAYDRGKVTATSSTVLNAQGDSQQLLYLDPPWCQISWNGSSFVVDTGKEDYPCAAVTWYGSVAFCNYLSEMESREPCYNLRTWECDWNAGGYRLPTEAEWEYAAKGGESGQKTKYAGSDNIDEVAWYWENSTNPDNPMYDGRGTHQVGTKAANELGIHDLSGNVWEWCWDWYWYESYSSASVTDPRVTGRQLVRRRLGLPCRRSRLLQRPRLQRLQLGLPPREDRSGPVGFA